MQKTNGLKKSIGYMFLALSLMAWAAIALLPFIDISKVQVAGTTTFLIITGELLFWAAIILLGKEVWEKIKSTFKRNK